MKLNAYTLPMLISLGLHALMLGIVTWNWEATPEPSKVERPNFVEAELVELTSSEEKEAEQKAKQQKIIDMRRRQQEQQEREAEQRRQREAEQQRRAQEQKRQEQEAERKAEAERERQEAQRREQQRQEELEQQQIQKRLDQALVEEGEFLDQQQSRATAQSYVALIAQRVEQNWSRPPSARAGMQCVLLIQLVPTGQVVNVTVVQSSGNAAFDRSAEQAVKRVDRFEEVQDMPPEVFESHFRQLRLEFKPEDLRL